MTYVIVYNLTMRVATTTTTTTTTKKPTPNNYTRTTDNTRLDHNSVDHKSSSY